MRGVTAVRGKAPRPLAARNGSAIRCVDTCADASQWIGWVHPAVSQVPPRPGRVVLMDQDISHAVTVPCAEAGKLNASRDQVASDERDEIRIYDLDLRFGSAIRICSIMGASVSYTQWQRAAPRPRATRRVGRV